MAIYTVHGGHAKHGNKYCGAVGYISESLADRDITSAIIKAFRAAGHTAYDCSVDSGISQGNIISKIKKNINSHPNAKANISVHLNAVSKSKADGKIKGSEVIIYSTQTEAEVIAIKVCLNLKALGFTNRGVKVRKDLGILKGITNGGANILVECFFCDDQDDYNLYTKLGPDVIGKAIAEGVLGNRIETQPAKKKYDVPKPTIKKGSQGEEVEKLQTALNYLVGYKLKEILKVDGDAGQKTIDALKVWQKLVGLEDDGSYGPASYRVMDALLS